MVLDKTSERRVLHLKKSNNDEGDEVNCYYTDILLGLYLVRGDSMVLLGEVDGDDDEGIAPAEPGSDVAAVGDVSLVFVLGP